MDNAEKADIGLVGLAVMGQNLVLNMLDRGYRVAVYNRTVDKVDAFVAGPARGRNAVPTRSPAEFVEALGRPRRIILLVKAGSPVDAVIDLLAPLLDAGDVLIDCGNSYFKDTIRRQEVLSERDLLYLGVGISGGEEGAKHGPSIMAGGSRQAWGLVERLFLLVAAKAAEDGKSCAAHLGPDGAGHFVKMVHNGIEYADMQLIAEAYHVMKGFLAMTAAEIGDVFAEWNKGELHSYLIEITADILRRIDEETGKPLVELVLDQAEQKGTGKWTSMESLDLGVPAPTIAEAVLGRYVSALTAEREQASRVLAGPEAGARGRGTPGDEAEVVEDLRKAVYAAKVSAYAQGFALLRKASDEYGWDLDLATIALIWRAGCIIRARFLNRIAEAYTRDKGLGNLLLDSHFRQVMADSQAGWRRIVSLAALNGIPLPAMGSALSWYDSFRSARLPASLIQAQRDYFGAHTYKRLDKPGTFHTDWRPSVANSRQEEH